MVLDARKLSKPDKTVKIVTRVDVTRFYAANVVILMTEIRSEIAQSLQ